MAVSVTLALANAQVVADSVNTIVATVSNTNSTSVTLNSLVASATPGGVSLSQPVIVTPNVAPGVGNPVLAATSGSASYGFQFVCSSPAFAGPSPQNQPGNAAPPNNAAVPRNSNAIITVTGNSSDGSVFSASITVPVLSTVAGFPVAEGGAFQFTQGTNLVNLMTAL